MPFFARRSVIFSSRHVNVEVAATMRDALIMLCCECYRHILIDVSTFFSHGRRLAAIARKRQPEAKILCLVSAQDQPFARDASCEYVMKEYVFSNLLGLM